MLFGTSGDYGSIFLFWRRYHIREINEGSDQVKGLPETDSLSVILVIIRREKEKCVVLQVLSVKWKNGKLCL